MTVPWGARFCGALFSTKTLGSANNVDDTVRDISSVGVSEEFLRESELLSIDRREDTFGVSSMDFSSVSSVSGSSRSLEERLPQAGGASVLAFSDGVREGNLLSNESAL